MNLPPTPVTAAAAGAFSAIAWFFMSPLLNDDQASSSLMLFIGMLLLVAAPAHLFVIGIGQGKTFHERTLEPSFQWRLGAWLASALLTSGLTTLWK